MGNVLHELIRARNSEIVARARAKATLRSSLPCRHGRSDESIRRLLGQLCAALRIAPAAHTLMDDDARAYGGRLADLGFTASQVVYSYGDICQAVMDLALEIGASIDADDFSAFNRLLDDAIANALVGYERQREATILQNAVERVTALALTFQNGLSTATAASDALISDSADERRAMQMLLDQSLQRLQILLDRPAERRNGTRILDRERVFLHGVIQEATLGASIDASRRGVEFSEAPPDPLTFVLADRQLLLGTIAKLVRHVLRATPRGSRVAVKVRGGTERVSIDVEIECRLLPGEEAGPVAIAHEKQGKEHEDFVRGLWPIASALGATLSLHARGGGYVFSVALETFVWHGTPRSSSPSSNRITEVLPGAGVPSGADSGDHERAEG